MTLENKNNQKIIRKLTKPPPPSKVTKPPPRDIESGYPKIRIRFRSKKGLYFSILPPLSGKMRYTNYLHLSSLPMWQQMLTIFKHFGYIPSNLSLQSIRNKATSRNIEQWNTISPKIQSFIDDYNLIATQFPTECYRSSDQPPELSTVPQIDIIRPAYLTKVSLFEGQLLF